MYMVPSGEELAFSVHGYLLSLHTNHHHEHISIRLVWNAQTLLRGMKEAFRQCKVWLEPITKQFFPSRKEKLWLSVYAPQRWAGGLSYRMQYIRRIWSHLHKHYPRSSLNVGAFYCQVEMSLHRNVELFIVIMINMDVELIVAHVTRKTLRRLKYIRGVHGQTGKIRSIMGSFLRILG